MSVKSANSIDYDRVTYRVTKSKDSARWVCEMKSITGNIIGRGKGASPSQSVVSSQMDCSLRNGPRR